ncbi:hypothetical protein ES703_28182 [subsurface metagenome]
MSTDQKPDEGDKKVKPLAIWTAEEPNLIEPSIVIDDRFFYRCGHTDYDSIPATREILALRTVLSQAFDLLVDIKVVADMTRENIKDDPRFEAVRVYIHGAPWNISEYLGK